MVAPTVLYEIYTDADDADEHDDIFDPSSDDGDHGRNCLTFIAAIPDKINLQCHLGGPGNITIEDKVEGQYGFDLSAACGNIKVTKSCNTSIHPHNIIYFNLLRQRLFSLLCAH